MTLGVVDQNRFSEKLKGLAFLGCLVFGVSVQSPAAIQETAFTCNVAAPAVSRSAVNLNSVSSLGTSKLIFYRVRFPDDKSDPITTEEANETLSEVNAILKKISGGKFQLEWTVSPVLTLSSGRNTYTGPGGFDLFLNDVRAAGAAAGYDYLQYDLDIARHSGVSTFQGGNANLGTRGAQVQAPGAVLIVHELG